MPNFSEILNKPAESVEKPKPKPTGSYIGSVQGMPSDKTVTVQGEQRGILEFKLKLTAAHTIDNPEQLDTNDVTSWPPFVYSIWYDTPEGEFQLRNFLTKTLGIDETGNKTFGELIAQAPGRQLLVTLKHRPYVDKNTGEPEIATDVGGVAKL